MPVKLPPDHEFVAPREDFPVDLDSFLSLVPDGAIVKGMFMNRTLSQAPPEFDEDEILERAGLDNQRFVPFRDYTWVDFIKLVATVGELLVGEGKTAAGMRRVGRSYYPEFAQSLAGKVTFGLLGRNADRVMALGPKAWNMSATLGEVSGETLGDCHMRYHFAGYPADVAETLGVGVLDGALDFCHSEGSFEFARVDIMNSVVDVRWT